MSIKQVLSALIIVVATASVSFADDDKYVSKSENHSEVQPIEWSKSILESDDGQFDGLRTQVPVSRKSMESAIEQNAEISQEEEIPPSTFGNGAQAAEVKTPQSYRENPFQSQRPMGSNIPESIAGAALQGITKPSQDAELKVTTPGVVTRVHVREGDWVKAGDPLVTLDDRVAAAAVEVAKNAAESKAAVQQAEWALKAAHSILIRTEIAVRTQAASQFELQAKTNEYEQAHAAYELQVELSKKAVAELRLAEAELEQKTLRAPFAGQVLAIKAKLGNTLDLEDVAVRVADLSQLRVEMHLPIHLLGSIQKNRIYQLQANAPVDAVIPAFVQFASPVLEPTSGTFRTVFSVDNSDSQLPAGIELWFDESLQGLARLNP